MCLLIVTYHSVCGHNIYNYGTCAGQTAHNQCPNKETEVGMQHLTCTACGRWADLARAAQEERRYVWVYRARAQEKAMAIRAERDRRRTLEVLGGRTLDPYGNACQFDTV